MMHRNHEEELTRRLEQVEDTGFAFVTWMELYRWYETQKIMAATYRDLAARWEEIKSVPVPRSKTKKGRLGIVARSNGMFLFPEGDLHFADKTGLNQTGFDAPVGPIQKMFNDAPTESTDA